MKPIKTDIEHGLLPNPYEIRQKDMGRLLDWFEFGRVIKSDVGRKVYVRGGILQMESLEQMARRKGLGLLLCEIAYSE
jgi:hypothetical protein